MQEVNNEGRKKGGRCSSSFFFFSTDKSRLGISRGSSRIAHRSSITSWIVDQEQNKTKKSFPGGAIAAEATGLCCLWTSQKKRSFYVFHLGFEGE